MRCAFPSVDSHSLYETLLRSQENAPGSDVISAARFPARGIEKLDLGNFLITLQHIQLVSACTFLSAIAFLSEKQVTEN
jgi:hypothetical protein